MIKDPLKIPTEEEAKRKEDNQKNERSKELEDLKDVLKSPGGRRFIHRLITYTRPFSESYVVGMFDATANNEGRRMVGNWIMAEILDADPDRYFQMCREYKSQLVAKKIIEENKEENNA